MDGSSIVDRSSAAYGGIIRDHNGNFVGACSANLRACTNNLVELWGTCWGLCFSKNMGLEYVILELDSNCSYYFISDGIPTSHVYSTLVDNIRKMLQNDDWVVEKTQIYGEASECANSLAKKGHQLSIGVTFFDRLLGFISIEFLVDFFGCSSARVIHLYFHFSLDRNPDVNKKKFNIRY